MACFLRPNYSLYKIIKLNSTQCIRCISTSDKKKDTVTGAITEQPKDSIDFSAEGVKKRKAWVSYGWTTKSEEEDRAQYRTSFFGGITICLVGGGFLFMYAPDTKLRNWMIREAFLKLELRERLGLPPIDKEFIPVEKIHLPSDEELGDMEIII